MAITTTKSAFLIGARDGAPFVLVAAPFALLFGLLCTQAGLSVFEIMSFSFVVVAGAAQFTALQLMQDNVPTVLVIISGLAVNLRVAMYSAALTPYLGDAPLWQRALASYMLVDQSYALSHLRFETHDEPLHVRIGYYFGSCVPVLIVWFAATYIGAVAGERLLDSVPIGFALPLAFLAMTGPALRTLPHVAAAITATIVSLLASGLPYSFGLVVGGIAGMICGAQLELWLERRKP